MFHITQREGIGISVFCIKKTYDDDDDDVLLSNNPEAQSTAMERVCRSGTISECLTAASPPQVPPWGLARARGSDLKQIQL